MFIPLNHNQWLDGNRVHMTFFHYYYSYYYYYYYMVAIFIKLHHQLSSVTMKDTTHCFECFLLSSAELSLKPGFINLNRSHTVWIWSTLEYRNHTQWSKTFISKSFVSLLSEIPLRSKRQIRKIRSLFTSSMFGMMSFSHCLRNESLSKLGSALTISVSTSDISVLEKRPPRKNKQQKQHQQQHLSKSIIISE